MDRREERRATDRSNADRRAHHDAMFMLARAAELSDNDTGDHAIRIRKIVELIARMMGIPDADALGCDAMLHDVGKLSVPQSILKKPGRLSDEERRVIESHTVFGEQFLSQRSSMQRAARIARSHHECWDGSGYPDGLRGDRIPIEARITTAADILDALVEDRCYKEPRSYEDAIERVCSLGGTVLDPVVVEALRACHADGSLRRIFEESADAASRPTRST